MELIELINRVEKSPDLEAGHLQDGHDEMRREIRYLLATVRAKLALLPRLECPDLVGSSA